MKVLGNELEINLTDRSAIEFRDEVVHELEKCLKLPFAMNSESEMQQVGQQEALIDIIEYLKYVI